MCHGIQEGTRLATNRRYRRWSTPNTTDENAKRKGLDLINQSTAGFGSCKFSGSDVLANIKTEPQIAEVSKKVVRAPRRTSRDAARTMTKKRKRIPSNLALVGGRMLAIRQKPAIRRTMPMRYANQG